MESEIYLKLALEAAQASGKFISEDLDRRKSIISEKGKDIKLGADIIADQIIINNLKTNSSFPVLTEESGLHGLPDDTSPKWIVDPLDGSLNFNRGIPMYCTSVALWKGDNPFLGVIYDISRDRSYSGIVSQGAKLDNVSISVSGTSEVSQSILATGFPTYRNFDTGSISRFIDYIQRFKKIRLFGSAALSLAFVASGVVDAYCEEDIAIWDVAAGLALVEAAGGSIKVLKNPDKMNLVTAIATNGLIDPESLLH